MSLPKTHLESAVVSARVQSTNPLIDRIHDRTAVVGVLGLGYVGLPLACEAALEKFPVIGFDLDPRKIEAIDAGSSYIRDVSDETLKQVTTECGMMASTDLTGLGKCDVIVIAVPTPLTKNLAPDLSFIISAGESIAASLRPGQLITLESTTYPGTTEEVLQPILEATGLKAGVDFFLAHSPERVDPGNKTHQTKNTPKVVGAVDANSQEVANAFYSAFIDHVVQVSSARSAELVKVYENVFRAVNVGLVNELAMLCDRMDLNVWEVLDAAYTKPFGILPFYPGPGVGGHCIPLDPHYLEHKAREFHFNTRFISVAGEINRNMPKFVVDKAMRALNERSKPLRGAKIQMLGVAYKADIDDSRESPAIEVIRLLLAEGANVQFIDPHVREIREHGVEMQATPYSIIGLQEADLVIITTNHSQFCWEEVVANSDLVLDTRNATKHIKTGREKIRLL